MRGYVKKLSQKIQRLSREQLESLMYELIDENEILYSIMESLSTGLLIVDNNFVLLQNNQIVESQLHFTCHLEDYKLENGPIWEIIDDQEIAEYLRNCAEKNITNSSEDFSTVTSGGTVRFFSLSISPLILKNQQKGRIIVVHDVTGKKQQDVLLHRMENMANLTNLAAGMAHEIKNPLGAISIHMQLIQRALVKARENSDVLPGKKFVEDHIDVVNEEVSHLNKLVMDFLYAVRPVNATLQLKNPVLLIQNTVDFFKAEFNRYRIEVLFNYPEKKEKIMLDEKLFRDVIINLAQNSLAAIKAKFPECNEEVTDNQQFIGQFEISCDIKDNKYCIYVRDNGCGMSPQTIEKLFEPYYTTKANGTGLGMTMVYKIIKEFSGEIQVASVENEGTEFILLFPLPQTETKLLTEGR